MTNPERTSPNDARPMPLRQLGGIIRRYVSLPEITPREEDHAQTPLPDEYFYTDPDSVDPQLLARLFCRRIGWMDSTRRSFMTRAQHFAEQGMGLINVAVGHHAGRLAGFASVLHKDSAGLMCDLGVDPLDRGVGLGKALVLERIRLADEAGIISLEMPFLMETNPLESFYLDQGFKKLADDSFVRGADNRAFLEANGSSYQ